MNRIVSRVFTILEYFTTDKPEWRVKELSEKSGFSKLQLFEVLTDLETLGILTRDQSSKKFRIGKNFFDRSKSDHIEKNVSDEIPLLFEFPREIKNACTQYLVYFSQFLYDLGIDTSIELKESASLTLFKIKPKNKIEALENIMFALNTYLNIPAVDFMDDLSAISEYRSRN